MAALGRGDGISPHHPGFLFLASSLSPRQHRVFPPHGGSTTSARMSSSRMTIGEPVRASTTFFRQPGYSALLARCPSGTLSRRRTMVHGFNGQEKSWGLPPMALLPLCGARCHAVCISKRNHLTVELCHRSSLGYCSSRHPQRQCS